ncbi:hypothetical protein BXP70_18510 [Hymenobacter crusticola]|uniref:Secretion system C-terminal sorting domain-containing protein n=2 Tax=Hymenobacter crusticola TaxID=1770526 RepID=A0A243WAI1_9BACT|nr:hypothetical protein BXP70_18510 [Hymenobacter crusticola]
MLFALVLLSDVASAQTFDQVTAIDARLGNGTAVGYNLATDAAGNVYVTGTFQGRLVLGSTTLTSVGADAQFVAKLDGNGSWVWAVRGGNTSSQSSFSSAPNLTVDGAGNVYVTGPLLGSFAFGSTVLQAASRTGADIMVARLNGTTGAWEWAVRAGNADNVDNTQQGTDISVDATGHVYVTGGFSKSTTFYGPAATPQLTLTSTGSTSDIFVARLAATTGAWQWAVHGGGAGSDLGTSLTVDASGSVYLTGSFQGTAASPASFSPAAGTSALTLTSPGGSSDIVVAKLDENSGTWQWAVRGGSTEADAGTSIATDASGHVFVTGKFKGGGTVNSYPPIPVAPATFDSPSAAQLTLTGTPSALHDIFVARLDATTGNWQWIVRGGGGYTNSGTSIVVDATGTPSITGYFGSGASFTPTSSGSPINLTGLRANNGFLARLDAATGAWQQVTSVAAPNGSTSYGSALDGNGHVFQTGFVIGNAKFGDSPATTVLGSHLQNVFIARQDATAGAVQWVVSAEAGGMKQVVSTTSDAAGNVYVAGVFRGTIVFGNTTLTSEGTYEGSEGSGSDLAVFIAKLNPAGAYQWAVRIVGTALYANNNPYLFDIRRQGFDIAADASGHVYITGGVMNSATFYNATTGSVALTLPQTSPQIGYNRVRTFVGRLEASSGTWQWAVPAGTDPVNSSGGFCLAIDADDNPYVGGIFQEKATFAKSGGGEFTLTAEPVYSEMYVGRLNPADGTWRWVVRGGGPSNDVIYGIATDASGHVFVTGCYIGSSTFDSPTGTQLTSSGFVNGTQAVVARLDAATGNWQWVAKAGTTDRLSQGVCLGRGIAVDASGDPYVTGNFTKDAVFGSSALNPGGDQTSAFVARLDGATGTWRWAVSSKAGAVSGDNIEVDKAGHVYVVGTLYSNSTYGTPVFNAVPATGASLLTPTTYGDNDGFVAQLSTATGAWQQVATVGGTGQDQGADLVLGSQNRLYVSGNYMSSEPAFGSLKTLNGGTHYSTGFLARLSSGWVLPVREKQLEAQKASFRVFPTLVSTGQSLRYAVEEQLGKEALIELYTATGQRVAQWSVSAATGALPAPALRAGVYLVRLTSAGTTQATRIVVY